MATTDTYYINGTSLSTATAIFTDNALTQCAPDGYYSDGNVSRQQVDCILLPPADCGDCILPCNQTININGGQGVYYMDIDIAGILKTPPYYGAVVIRFNAENIPDGIIARFAGKIYNGVSSKKYGWLQGEADKPTYIGNETTPCAQNLVSSSPYTLTEYKYQGNQFVDLGTTTTVTVGAGQLDLTPLGPDVSTMVIPRAGNNSSILSIEIYGVCSDTIFNAEINCPTLLYQWEGSEHASNATDACTSSPSVQYYIVFVNGLSANNSLVIKNFDMVFLDVNGEDPMPEGYYSYVDATAPNPQTRWIRVDEHGVVIATGICDDFQSYLVELCNFPEVTEVVSTNNSTLPIGTYINISTGNPNPYALCVFKVVDVTTAQPTAQIVSVSNSSQCTSQCSKFNINNTSGTPQTIQYVDCSGTSSSIQLSNNETLFICGREIPTAQIPSGVTITHGGCRCFSYGVYRISLCPDSNIQFDAIANIPVQIGGLVNISNPAYADYWFVVESVSTATPTTSIISNSNAPASCAESCALYEVTNITSSYQEVTYVSCAGVNSTLGIQGNQVVDVCARVDSFGTNNNLTIDYLSPCSEL